VSRIRPKERMRSPARSDPGAGAHRLGGLDRLGPMARAVDIACFKSEPSIPSSLKFLRKTPWARTKVERLYVNQRRKRRRPAPARPRSFVPYPGS